MRYLMTFSYDGSCFHGYERQKNLDTVQGLIETVLTGVNNGSSVTIQSSGRTDVLVHALNQKAHFDLDVKVNLYSLKKHLNKKFEGKIYVKNIELVSEKFHARYNVKSKKYVYYINTLEFNPFRRNYELQYCKKLDLDKMHNALNYFVGEHDFRSFCKGYRENCVRTIYDASITEKDGIISIEFNGNGFLRAMVRNIVTVLIDVGIGKIDDCFVKSILDAKDNKFYNIKTISGCGLYLEDVVY